MVAQTDSPASIVAHNMKRTIARVCCLGVRVQLMVNAPAAFSSAFCVGAQVSKKRTRCHCPDLLWISRAK
jgi:hypothetical protein